jgi:hypothetical protein
MQQERRQKVFPFTKVFDRYTGVLVDVRLRLCQCGRDDLCAIKKPPIAWRLLVLCVDLLCAVEQHSIRVFRAFSHLTVVEAFAIEVNLDERGTGSERALDQRL